METSGNLYLLPERIRNTYILYLQSNEYKVRSSVVSNTPGYDININSQSMVISRSNQNTGSKVNS